MDLQKCAQYHVDKHIVKMPVETTQMLSNTFYFTDHPEYAPYLPANVNNPCSLWARESLSNWLWLKWFGICLCYEYTYRYERKHSCEYKIRYMPDPNIVDIGLTPRPASMPKYYITDNIVESYRNYYNGEKRHLFKWTRRDIPYWIER